MVVPGIALTAALVGGLLAFVGVSPAGAQPTDVFTYAAYAPITATALTLGGEVNPNESETECSVHYNTTGVSPWLTAAASPRGDGVALIPAGDEDVPVWVTISGLSPATVYYYELVCWWVSEPGSPVYGPFPMSQQTSGAAGTTPRTTSTTGLSTGSPPSGVTRPMIAIDSTSVVLSAATPVTAQVAFTCAVATCSGSVRLERTGGKTELLAQGAYRITKGKTAAVLLRLTPQGRVVLKNATTTPLVETLVATLRGGKRTRMSVVVS
ncbi:MAG TPA: hypothetical protein VED84_05060 [Acidimicrobiales bacterium]|nr:hypothetical protein [Acidimicrobiales bacterium]